MSCYLFPTCFTLVTKRVGYFIFYGITMRNEDGTDNYEPTEETIRDINNILELFASQYAVNIMYSVEQNKTLLFYIPEEYLENKSKSYVVQVKGIKNDKWQTCELPTV